MTEDERIVAQIGFEKGIEAAANARGMWFGFNSSGEPTGEYCTVKPHDPDDDTTGMDGIGKGPI